MKLSLVCLNFSSPFASKLSQIIWKMDRQNTTTTTTTEEIALHSYILYNTHKPNLKYLKKKIESDITQMPRKIHAHVNIYVYRGTHTTLRPHLNQNT